MKSMNKQANERGLTLIEMIVVIAILGLLVGAALPYISDFRDDGKRREQKRQFERIQEGYKLWLQVQLMQEPDLKVSALYSRFLPTAMNDSSIVSKQVLLGNAGTSYLSYWTPEDFRQLAAPSPAGEFGLLDVWGDALQLDFTSGAFSSNGPNPTDPANSKMTAVLPAGEILVAEAKAREEVVNQAIRAYFESNFTGPHPQGWSYYYDENPLDPNLSVWSTLSGQSPAFLNLDERWKNPDMIATSNPPVIKFLFVPGDWLRVTVAYDVSPPVPSTP